MAQPISSSACNKSRHSHHKWCWDAATRRPCAQRYMPIRVLISFFASAGFRVLRNQLCEIEKCCFVCGNCCGLARSCRFFPVLLRIDKQFICRLAPMGGSIAYEVSLGFGRVRGRLRVRKNLLSRTTKTMRSKLVIRLLAEEWFHRQYCFAL